MNAEQTSFLHRLSSFPLTVAGCLAALLSTSCGAVESGPAVLTAEVPLHLEEHLKAARIEGSEVSAQLPKPVEWRFDQPQPDWKPAVPLNPAIKPVSLLRTQDALRMMLTDANKNPNNPNSLVGGFYVDLPGWRREDWAHVVVRARTSDEVSWIGVAFNLRERSATTTTGNSFPFRYTGDNSFPVRDGAVQTYVLRADWSGGEWEGPWRQLGIWVRSDKPASIDILSIAVMPKEALYAHAPAGARAEARNLVYRSALFVHAPGRLEYRLRVPAGGRLDVGLGVLRNDVPVTFRVTATPDNGETARLFEETYKDPEGWAQRSVDLSRLAGQTVTLGLATEAAQAGTIALWGAPTLTGSAAPARPNVIFYVIDGGAADFMSVYGYHRRTTPTLERLAAQGAVFERAYSNSSWTRPSTASFMTSLHNSVMGGLLNWNDPVPEQAVTMAEHMHRAGYQTAVFTANPNAGTLSDLQRGVDLFREDWKDFAYFGEGRNHKESSRFLNEGFWSWREGYPRQPYWVHFQATDVHEEFPAVSPFAGLFVGPAERQTWKDWEERLGKATTAEMRARGVGGHGVYSEAYAKARISRTAFFSIQQGLYDETMAHNDYQLGRLVDRLKAEGEWENTLLIIGADHSTRAAMDDMGIALSETLPPQWGQPMFRPTISRVPLIIVWPGRIKEGQRFAQPVSMIDVLPTVLDLVGLPPAEIAQGRSLAPLLLGTRALEPRPVILDEFDVDQQTGKLWGLIDVVDGRWGASLTIGRVPESWPKERRRPVPLLLYDLWNDPMCLRSVHEERPELVKKYTTFLEAQFAAHQELAKKFTRSKDSALSPEQLRTLRSLGYIR